MAANTGSGTSVLTAGGFATALGSLGVLVTTVFYAVSPPAAAMPKQPFDLIAALRGAIAGATTMQAASLFGIFSDVVLATGALLIGLEAVRRGRGVSAAGWVAIFISVVIFIFVDAIVGQVLVPLAAAQAGNGVLRDLKLLFGVHGENSGFHGFKLLFDTLFLLGTAAFGAGAALAMLDELRTPAPLVAKPFAWAGLILGVVGILAAAACFGGLPLELAVGAAVGLGSVLFIVIGLQIARTGARAS